MTMTTLWTALLLLLALVQLNRVLADDDECGIWLARSTIPGSGLGMFAGKDYQDKDILGSDLVIPLIDLRAHHGRDFKFLWDEYTWHAGSLNMEHESNDVHGASFGFGAAANSFLDLENVMEHAPQQDAAGLSRRHDPGVGAFTTYHDRQTTAIGSVKAADELFVSYGPGWFEGREYLGMIPLKGDHNRANDLLQKFLRLKEALNASLAPVLDELWETFVMESDLRTKSRILNAIPASWEETESAMEQGVLQHKREQHRVTLEWLQQYGTCMDNIVIRPSTLRQAGRGAFSTRFLKKGSVVAPLPLIHIPYKERFEMYAWDEEQQRLNYEHVIGTQLLENYCMGHSKSTMLLCPYGLATSAVNHNQSLANVRLQWGDSTRTLHNSSWFNESVHALDKKDSAGLVMELVATRDIEPGEEVFMDYGDEWERAWQNHVKSWAPDQTHYKSASEWNDDDSIVLRTAYEAIKEPYPENIEIRCRQAFKNRKRWQKSHINGTLREIMRDIDSESWSECDVLRREQADDGSVWYDALLYENNETDPQVLVPEFMLKKVPRQAFVFVDKPYQSDMHLPNAFRHEIMIPDEMFPEAWKNI